MKASNISRIKVGSQRSDPTVPDVFGSPVFISCKNTRVPLLTTNSVCACWERATISTLQKRCPDFADLDDVRKASLPSKDRRVGDSGVKVSFPTTPAFCCPGKARISNNPGDTPETRQAKQRLGGLGVSSRARIKGWGWGWGRATTPNPRFEILHSCRSGYL